MSARIIFFLALVVGAGLLFRPSYAQNYSYSQFPLADSIDQAEMANLYADDRLELIALAADQTGESKVVIYQVYPSLQLLEEYSLGIQSCL